MSDLNDPLKESYIGKVADAVKPYAAELKANEFDPTPRISALASAGVLIEEAGKARKAAEKAATDAIKNEQNIREKYYKLAVGTISLVEGAVGKEHELTVKLRGLRGDLIGNQNAGGVTPPAPAPAPAKPQAIPLVP